MWAEIRQFCAPFTKKRLRILRAKNSGKKVGRKFGEKVAQKSRAKMLMKSPPVQFYILSGKFLEQD